MNLLFHTKYFVHSYFIGVLSTLSYIWKKKPSKSSYFKFLLFIAENISNDCTSPQYVLFLGI